MKRVAVVLVALAVSSACAAERAAPASSPTPVPDGEPGVVRLIEDEPATHDPNAVPGAGVTYGRYAPGSR